MWMRSLLSSLHDVMLPACSLMRAPTQSHVHPSVKTIDWHERPVCSGRCGDFSRVHSHTGGPDRGLSEVG